jgi:D-beta-D-heptose 7-phosphate kinase/D-beta-D-heptose 1-phosphate adenosyltransferase
VVKRCRKAGIKVVVDPKGTDYAKYHGATVITPNFSEFQAAVQQPITTEAQVHQHGLNLRQSLELEAMLVTRSEKGMSIIFASGEKVDIPTRAREVYDITGAGDTAVAAMSLALASGWTLADAAQFSNYAAGVVVGKVGTATTTVAEVIHAVERDARGD